MFYKIGVDVGGTNTDAVLVSQKNEIIAKTKQNTTYDISSGIEKAIREVLEKSNTERSQVKYLMLGTTHCTNSLVERKGLCRIGAIRIGLPASKSVSILSDFPEDLKSLLGKHNYMVHGGYEFDGRTISPLDEYEVKGCLSGMKNQIDALAITGIFSKTCPNQELEVASWAREVLGANVRISCSNQIGGLGLIERENATIINASLQQIAQKMIEALKQTVTKLGLTCKLFIGQNDGTLLSLEQAQQFPVLTISSGPTNSIRGAGYLTNIEEAIVIDVGGTTADAGMLVDSFPRESSQSNEIGGVLTNFRMPDVVSVGMGGGTVVRFTKNGCRLGPDSVGHKLKREALSFGGQNLTLSDFFIADNKLHINSSLDYIALRKLISENTGLTYRDAFERVKNSIKMKTEKMIDTLKTNSSDVVVVACGGGAFLLPNKIEGVSKVLYPNHMEVANAFGACIAQVSNQQQLIINTQQNDEKSAMENLSLKVKNTLISQGSKPESIRVLTKESTPLAYLAGAVKLNVKACGDLIF